MVIGGNSGGKQGSSLLNRTRNGGKGESVNVAALHYGGNLFQRITGKMRHALSGVGSAELINECQGRPPWCGVRWGHGACLPTRYPRRNAEGEEEAFEGKQQIVIYKIQHPN